MQALEGVTHRDSPPPATSSDNVAPFERAGEPVTVGHDSIDRIPSTAAIQTLRSSWDLLPASARPPPLAQYLESKLDLAVAGVATASYGKAQVRCMCHIIRCLCHIITCIWHIIIPGAQRVS